MIFKFEKLAALKLFVAVLLFGLLSVTADEASAAEPVTHEINLAVMEVKGTTTVDWQEPPTVNPESLSRGYEYYKPGHADKDDPAAWRVSSYLFSPGHITIKQSDRVNITAFITNGNEHKVTIRDPDGAVVMEKTTWSRGREYKLSFDAEKTGIYTVDCLSHAPTMSATIYVIP